MLVGCGSERDAVPTVSFDTAFEEAVRLHGQETFPNSMAREEGFDLKQHIADVHADFVRVSQQFQNEAGVAYLGQKLHALHDEEAEFASHCAIVMLAESGRDDAVALLARLARGDANIMPHLATAGSEERERITGHAADLLAKLRAPNSNDIHRQ
jgi:hypothetical protein